MTFEDYYQQNISEKLQGGAYLLFKETWNAAQQAERERIRARVMQAAVKSWHGDDLAIGVPYVRLKAFTDALLGEE